MTKCKPRVIVTRKVPDEIETRMMELFETRLNVDDGPLSADDLGRAVQGCDVLVPTVTDRIDADLLEVAGPDLKLIANFGNGVDHIDLAAARHHCHQHSWGADGRYRRHDNNVDPRSPAPVGGG